MADGMKQAPKPVRDDVTPYVIAGLAAVGLIVGGFGGWAATADLSGAVVASGRVVVDSNVKKVQHNAGGIVGEIRVRDGDRVVAGDLLLRLDDTITRVNLQIIMGQLDELAIRRARLDAERDGRGEFIVPAQLAGRLAEPNVAEIVGSERSLFESRRSGRAGQKAQLGERIAQLRKEIDGLEAQQHAKGEEIELIGRELVGLLALQKKSLVPSLKVTSLQRESARLGGERAQLIALVVEARIAPQDIEQVRHGQLTALRFTAFNQRTTPEVLGQVQRVSEFIAFLRKIDRCVKKALDVHVVLDNSSTHKMADVKTWLAKHPRFKLHFTPTSASWLNLVERFFAEITRKRIRRGTFTSVADLEAAIEYYLLRHNANPKPFVWTKPAKVILEKQRRALDLLDLIKTGYQASESEH